MGHNLSFNFLLSRRLPHPLQRSAAPELDQFWRGPPFGWPPSDRFLIGPDSIYKTGHLQRHWMSSDGNSWVCLQLARILFIFHLLKNISIFSRFSSLTSKLLMTKKANSNFRSRAFRACLIFHGREMGRGLSAKNTSRAAFCRQWRTKQSFNESRVAPKAQPSTGGVIHILLIAGWRSAPLIDTAV